MNITHMFNQRFIKNLIKSIQKSEATYYVIGLMLAIPSLELSLVAILALTIYMVATYNREFSSIEFSINEHVVSESNLHGVKVRNLSPLGASLYGPAFALGPNVYAFVDSKDLNIGRGVIYHEQCHALHNDSYNFLISKVIATIITSVIVASISSAMGDYWLALLPASFHIAKYAYAVLIVINNFFGKLIETRADCFAVKYVGNNTLQYELPEDDNFSAGYVMAFTPYFPMPLRKKIIRQYSMVVNKK